jgi:CDP-diacylglycerol--glycerol-3-phosphate 3-phosphatidyltransferase
MWFGKQSTTDGNDLFEFLPSEQVHLHDKFLEKTILRIIPTCITPNQITAFRVFLTPWVLFFISNGNYYIGVVLFLFAAFTDAIDGTMARTRNQITRFGMLFDPLADKLLIGTAVIILVFKYFNHWLGIIILGIEIAFIISAFVIKIKFKTVRMANLWGKIKMFLQVFAVFITLMALLLEDPALFTVAAWFFGFAIGFAILSLFTHGI